MGSNGRGLEDRVQSQRGEMQGQWGIISPTGDAWQKGTTETKGIRTK